MSELVVDASAAISWVTRSQATGAAESLFARLDEFALAAPHIFAWEVANILLGLHRREPRLDLGSALGELASLEITFHPPFAPIDVWATVPRARAWRLSLFDTNYLGLALEQGAALASRDRRLLAAARREGVETFDLND
ncbi:MAG: type II toxin-antitoxin system VapC family toxin [Caulobacteraceae bacterium]|nr:type II toxin-antitoxin system VapC family toxin [Caulobacteraceae bacterium]